MKAAVETMAPKAMTMTMKVTVAMAMIVDVPVRFWKMMHQQQMAMLHFEMGIAGSGCSWQSFSPEYSQSLASLTREQEDVMHRASALPGSKN